MSRVETMRGRMLISMSARTQNAVREIGIQASDSRSSVPFVGQIMNSLFAIEASFRPLIEQFGANENGDCTLRCARVRSFVHYDSETKTIYPFNDQKKTAPNSGQKVKVSGTHERWLQIADITLVIAPNPDFLKFDSLLFSHGYVRN
jgi:hypothetical protein